jgi:hypothetical protein
MKKILTITLLFFCSNCLASPYFDTLNLALKTCRTKADLIKRCNTKLGKFDTKIGQEWFGRNLDFNYRQSVYVIGIEYKYYLKDEKKYRIHSKSFAIYLVLNSEDSIIIGVVREVISWEPGFEKIEKSDVFCLNLLQLDDYLTQHEQLYKMKKNKTEFINQITGLIIYGFGCSNGGGYYSPEAIKMIKYVRKNKYKKLSNWLKEINPELQVYAIEGLMMLANRGIKIKPNDALIIQHLKDRNSKINYCSGCAYGLTTTIEDVLKMIEWDEKRIVFRLKNN